MTSSLPPALQRTLKLKANYLVDLRYSKQLLVCQPLCPAFPDALWKDMLAGRFIDLDRVLASTYSICGDWRESIKLGNYELLAAAPKPALHVQTHGE